MKFSKSLDDFDKISLITCIFNLNAVIPHSRSISQIFLMIFVIFGDIFPQAWSWSKMTDLQKIAYIFC